MTPPIPLLDEFTESLSRDINASRFHAVDSKIYLTYRCTSRCKTCNIWKRNSEGSTDSELGWDEWKIILGRLVDYGIKSLEIFGGDALLRKDIIYDVISYCRDNGIETFFPTNSLLLDEEAAKKLVESGLGTIYFSLDDVSEENDKIRGQQGAFDLVAKAMDNICKERGAGVTPKIIVCTTISNMNYNHFERVVDFLSDYPISSLYPRVVGEFTDENIKNSVIEGVTPEPFFITTEGVSHLLTRDQLNVFKASLQRAKAKTSGTSMYINSVAIESAGDDAFTKGIYPDKKCLVCSTYLAVGPKGDVTPCPMYNQYTIGNLLEKPLDEIWGNERHKTFVKAQRNKEIKICANCVTRGYFPALSETCAYYLKKAVSKVKT